MLNHMEDSETIAKCLKEKKMRMVGRGGMIKQKESENKYSEVIYILLFAS